MVRVTVTTALHEVHEGNISQSRQPGHDDAGSCHDDAGSLLGTTLRRWAIATLPIAMLQRCGAANGRETLLHCATLAWATRDRHGGASERQPSSPLLTLSLLS